MYFHLLPVMIFPLAGRILSLSLSHLISGPFLYNESRISRPVAGGVMHADRRQKSFNLGGIVTSATGSPGSAGFSGNSGQVSFKGNHGQVQGVHPALQVCLIALPLEPK